MRRTFCAQKVIWNLKDPDSIEYQNGAERGYDASLAWAQSLPNVVSTWSPEATIKQTSQNCLQDAPPNHTQRLGSFSTRTVVLVHRAI